MDPSRKKGWKQKVKEAVHQMWTTILPEVVQEKKSLEFLELKSRSTDKIHPVW